MSPFFMPLQIRDSVESALDSRRYQATERFTIKSLPLEATFREYFNSIPENVIGPATLYTMDVHRHHLIRLLGKRIELRTVNLTNLQSYVNRHGLINSN
ncbi:MAG: hypothetical protein AAF497_04665 [Planctomycetota bacterium]